MINPFPFEGDDTKIHWATTPAASNQWFSFNGTSASFVSDADMTTEMNSLMTGVNKKFTLEFLINPVIQFNTFFCQYDGVQFSVRVLMLPSGLLSVTLVTTALNYTSYNVDAGNELVGGVDVLVRIEVDLTLSHANKAKFYFDEVLIPNTLADTGTGVSNTILVVGTENWYLGKLPVLDIQYYSGLLQSFIIKDNLGATAVNLLAEDGVWGGANWTWANTVDTAEIFTSSGMIEADLITV